MFYFDYAASAPIDPRVREAMLPHLGPQFGNAGSLHWAGRMASKAVERAREQVAETLAASPSEIIWTSGATEANNLALKGAALLYQNKGNHIVTVKTEHPSVLKTCQYLEKQGFVVTYLNVSSNGLLDIGQLQSALRPETILVSVMHMNNETGVIQNLNTIAECVKSHGALFHVDAAQSFGKINLDMKKTPIDFLSCCAHKCYGPQGIGVLYIRKKPRVRVATQLHGGGQELGLRSGTLPVHQIVGMGEAAFIAKENMSKEFQQLSDYRGYFWKQLSLQSAMRSNSDFAVCYPGIINVWFAHWSAEELMAALPQFAFSKGPACHADHPENTRVLRALGLSEKEAEHSVRFSLGRFTTTKEIEALASALNRL